MFHDLLKFGKATDQIDLLSFQRLIDRNEFRSFAIQCAPRSAIRIIFQLFLHPTDNVSESVLAANKLRRTSKVHLSTRFLIYISWILGFARARYFSNERDTKLAVIGYMQLFVRNIQSREKWRKNCSNTIVEADDNETTRFIRSRNSSAHLKTPPLALFASLVYSPSRFTGSSDFTCWACKIMSNDYSPQHRIISYEIERFNRYVFFFSILTTILFIY